MPVVEEMTFAQREGKIKRLDYGTDVGASGRGESETERREGPPKKKSKSDRAIKSAK